MKQKRSDCFKIIIIILFILPASLVFADEDDAEGMTYELSQITCTATRMERTRSEVPASVEVADEDTIKNTKMFNIREVLAGMPGVLIESKNQGYDSRIAVSYTHLTLPTILLV